MLHSHIHYTQRTILNIIVDAKLFLFIPRRLTQYRYVANRFKECDDSMTITILYRCHPHLKKILGNEKVCLYKRSIVFYMEDWTRMYHYTKTNNRMSKIVSNYIYLCIVVLQYNYIIDWWNKYIAKWKYLPLFCANGIVITYSITLY